MSLIGILFYMMKHFRSKNLKKIEHIICFLITSLVKSLRGMYVEVSTYQMVSLQGFHTISLFVLIAPYTGRSKGWLLLEWGHETNNLNITL